MQDPAHHASLNGKTVLITGAASGLGAALANLLAEAGADVAVGDIQRDRRHLAAGRTEPRRLAARDQHQPERPLPAGQVRQCPHAPAWPNASAYHASKWGLLGLSHALHAELRPYNIRVTAVVAGGMRTP